MTTIARSIEIYQQALRLVRDQLGPEIFSGPLVERIDRLIKAAIRVGHEDPAAIAANVVDAVKTSPAKPPEEATGL